MKPYILACVLVSYVLAMATVVLPFFFSADSDIALTIGVFLAFSVIPTSFWLVRKIWAHSTVQSLIKKLGE